MKEILIKFANSEPESIGQNRFNVYVDGEKIPRLKRIIIDFKNNNDAKVLVYDDFNYSIEQYVDIYDQDKFC